MCRGYENKTAEENDKRVNQIVNALEKQNNFVFFKTYQDYEANKKK